MSVNNVLNGINNNTNAVYFQHGQQNLGKSSLDREGFMQLIMAQLQYQDPTQPQDNSQMLTQQLQLNQADQMQSLVDSNTFGQASNMIGKDVVVPDSKWNFTNSVSTTPAVDANGNPKLVNGTVQSVQFDRATGKALLEIGGNYYDSSLIKSISASSTTTPTNSNNPTPTN